MTSSPDSFRENLQRSSPDRSGAAATCNVAAGFLLANAPGESLPQIYLTLPEQIGPVFQPIGENLKMS